MIRRGARDGDRVTPLPTVNDSGFVPTSLYHQAGARYRCDAISAKAARKLRTFVDNSVGKNYADCGETRFDVASCSSSSAPPQAEGADRVLRRRFCDAMSPSIRVDRRTGRRRHYTTSVFPRAFGAAVDRSRAVEKIYSWPYPRSTVRWPHWLGLPI